VSRHAKLLAASNTDRGTELVEMIDDHLSDAFDRYQELCEEAGIEPLDDSYEAFEEYGKVAKGEDES
jgi:hypothetical protein